MENKRVLLLLAKYRLMQNELKGRLKNVTREEYEFINGKLFVIELIIKDLTNID